MTRTCHILQGQPADIQSPTPMLEAHWETVHQHSSILFFKQAVLSLQVWLCASPTTICLGKTCSPGDNRSMSQPDIMECCVGSHLFCMCLSPAVSLTLQLALDSQSNPESCWVLRLQEVDLSVEEVFANQLVTMVKGLPFGDIFQEVTGNSQPGSVIHQENSQRALKVGVMDDYLSDRPQGR